jgi:hypothetical protein
MVLRLYMMQSVDRFIGPAQRGSQGVGGIVGVWDGG